MLDPSWREREAERHRKKAAVQMEKFPEKKLARVAIRYMRRDGFDAHHWSYNEEHRTDIIHLPPKEHRKLHRYSVYDQERMMYRRTDGSLIDSKGACIKYLKSLKGKP